MWKEVKKASVIFKKVMNNREKGGKLL